MDSGVVYTMHDAPGSPRFMLGTSRKQLPVRNNGQALCMESFYLGQQLHTTHLSLALINIETALASHRTVDDAPMDYECQDSDLLRIFETVEVSINHLSKANNTVHAELLEPVPAPTMEGIMTEIMGYLDAMTDAHRHQIDHRLDKLCKLMEDKLRVDSRVHMCNLDDTDSESSSNCSTEDTECKTTEAKKGASVQEDPVETETCTREAPETPE